MARRMTSFADSIELSPAGENLWAGEADPLYGHIGGIDVLAKALLNAEAIIKDGRLQGFIEERYSGWNSDFGKQALTELNLEQLADHALQANSDVRPPSGRQEYLENLINRFAS